LFLLEYSLLDHRKHEVISEEFIVDPVEEKLAQNHVSRLEDFRYPEQYLDY